MFERLTVSYICTLCSKFAHFCAIGWLVGGRYNKHMKQATKQKNKRTNEAKNGAKI